MPTEGDLDMVIDGHGTQIFAGAAAASHSDRPGMGEEGLAFPARRPLEGTRRRQARS